MVKSSLDALLNILAESGLDELGDFLAKDSVPVAHRKEVRPSVLTQMGKHQVRVLVHFVWVLRTVPSLRGERKFSHAVIELFLARLSLGWGWQGFRCCDFPSDRGPNRVAVSAVSSPSWIALLFVDVTPRLAVFGWHPSFLWVSLLPNFSDFGQILILIEGS